jgi:hypothetical protein
MARAADVKYHVPLARWDDVRYCDKQSSKHRYLAQRRSKPQGPPGPADGSTIHRLRCGSERSPPSASLGPRKKASRLRIRRWKLQKRLGPFHAVV